MKTFSIVVPVYQNEANLDDTVPRLLALGERLPGYRLELVFVEDGSRDRSWEKLVEHRRRHPGEIVLVRLSRNFGQNPAMQAGLRHATGDAVGIISADLQEPPERFAEMLAEWEKGAKFVMAVRSGRRDGGWRSVSGGLYWNLLRRFAWNDFPEMGYDFCLLDRQVVADVNRIDEKNTAVFQLIYWLGYRPEKITITRERRLKGESQWTLFKKGRLYMDTLIAFTHVPVRVVTLLGLTTSLLSVSYMLYSFARWLVLGSRVEGWTTIVLLISAFGALTLFSLGIICEYLWRILDASRSRPPFVVDQVERG